MKCRACNQKSLSRVLDLGEHTFGGFFPKPDEFIPHARLALMYCHNCTLVQLEDNGVKVEDLYGPHYGYRSGLNASMVDHLLDMAKMAQRWVQAPRYSPWLLDIGSNDGTLLRHFGSGYRRVGCDPNIDKWAPYYDAGVIRVGDFFSADNIRKVCGEISFEIITTIACFYDVEDPVKFAAEVYALLEDGGVWLVEVQDIDSMLDTNGFDAICHEHLTYFSTRSLQNVAEKAGLKLIDYKHTDANGGSIAMLFAKKKSLFMEMNMAHSDRDSQYERLHNLQHQTDKRLRDLAKMLVQLKERNFTVGAIGASTKGNTLLQCLIEHLPGPVNEFIHAVGEVNEDKYGRVTPGTYIPIKPEEEVMNDHTHLLVLPWHFRENLSKRFMPWMEDGGKLIFPLPEVEEVDAASAGNWNHRPRRMLPI